MPDEHAHLSPSASERWLSCPASVRLGADAPRTDSIYSLEGTKAHALGEIKLRAAISEITDKEFLAARREWVKMAPKLTTEQLDDMEEHTSNYVAEVMERASRHPDSVVLVEQRVDTGLPRCWGTADALIMSPVHVEVVDLKYGAGVAVEAESNTQLKLYGVGALDLANMLYGAVEMVFTTIFQPRVGAGVSSAAMTAEDLLAWREEIRPIAEEASAGSDRFGPSEKGCRWCPVSGSCRARTEWATAQDFSTPADLLSPDELAALLGQIPAIKTWCEDVQKHALDQAYSGAADYPGWKVVSSGGTRKILNQEEAAEALIAAGLRPSSFQTKPKLETLAVLDRVTKPMGGLKAVLGDLVGKTEGRPALVPEDDKREAIDRHGEASKEFASHTVPD